jgi:microcompartment protein CcmL/EutN
MLQVGGVGKEHWQYAACLAGVAVIGGSVGAVAAAAEAGMHAYDNCSGQQMTAVGSRHVRGALQHAAGVCSVLSGQDQSMPHAVNV